MDLHFKGRTALVTGTSHGIGFGVAPALAAEGCYLHLASRTAADLEAAWRKTLGASAVEVTCHARDLSVPENARELVLGAESADHGVRVVSNPDATETDRLAARLRSRAEVEPGDATRWRELTRAFPFGRLAIVEEVADVIVFRTST